MTDFKMIEIERLEPLPTGTPFNDINCGEHFICIDRYGVEVGEVLMKLPTTPDGDNAVVQRNGAFTSMSITQPVKRLKFKLVEIQ